MRRPRYAASLDVRPDQQQFFSGQSVSLQCVEDEQTAFGWTVRRNRVGQMEECGVTENFGVLKESSCVLDLLSSYSGFYWCQTRSGRRSDRVNITVTLREDSAIVLDIPALPLKTGSDVTLRCIHRDGLACTAYFYKNGELVSKKKIPEVILHDVQQSDEGLYWCASDKFGSSPRSFLRVTGSPLHHNITVSSPPPDSSFAPPNSTSPPPSSMSVLHLLRHLLVICPYCICSMLLVSMCFRRNPGNKFRVSMETSQPVGDYVGISTDVTTEHDF
ncbi:uncharacterized protein LOC133420729 [Cololabis saira]|uniref:uncharacterized protein LOC133420729 n=1 Tax=Cololabis saira TaxID=129043 RepID=UPI002AD2C3CA|nr:uncharacterized protein LOC133420729 [Cololabis saira]